MNKFHGQHKIVLELTYMISAIKRGQNLNILLLAQSGHGKTMLGEILLYELGGSSNSSIGGPPNFIFDNGKRFNFLDEVHELPQPEILYKLMDCGEYTIILATNESGQLKEPMINRCVPLIFEQYSTDELISMAEDTLGRGEMDGNVLNKIVECSGGNPRELKILLRRLQIIAKREKINTLDKLNHVLENILNIDTRGLNTNSRRYLDFIESVGGQASLSLISFGTGLDQITIKRDIEPTLLQRGLIRITSKGRCLV